MTFDILVHLLPVPVIAVGTPEFPENPLPVPVPVPMDGMTGLPYPVNPLPYVGIGTTLRVPDEPGVHFGCLQHGSLGLSCMVHSGGKLLKTGHLLKNKS